MAITAIPVAETLPFVPSKGEGPLGEQKGGLPFEKAGVAKMTLDQYAWLCAALAKAPERTEATLAWMKLSAADKEKLDRHFEEIFRADGKARGRFFQAMAKSRKEGGRG